MSQALWDQTTPKLFSCNYILEPVGRKIFHGEATLIVMPNLITILREMKPTPNNPFACPILSASYELKGWLHNESTWFEEISQAKKQISSAMKEK